MTRHHTKETDTPILLEPESAAKERGQRLSRLRNLANLSRKQLTDKYALNPFTLQSWEVGKYGGLSEKGANKILKALKNEGVICHLSWLMHGIGEGPKISEKIIEKTEENVTEQITAIFKKEEEKEIIKELLFFRQQHKKCLDFIVTDDGMEPLFIKGEYVAGMWRRGVRIRELIGLNCITQLENGNTLLRCIRTGSKQDLYNLVCINPQSTVKEVALYDVKLVKAAPVIWQRRLDPASK